MKKLFLNILYVEDGEVILRSTSNLLSMFCGNVYTATNGKEGLELFLKHKDEIDLIITDIRMPVMGGLDMIRLISDLEDIPLPKIYILTAFTNFEEESKKLRISRFITKPTQFEELYEYMKEDFDL